MFTAGQAAKEETSPTWAETERSLTLMQRILVTRHETDQTAPTTAPHTEQTVPNRPPALPLHPSAVQKQPQTSVEQALPFG